jgi:hypothetical protein
MALAGLGLPVNQESNGVLGLRDAVIRLASGNTCRRACNDASRIHLILDEPAADVNVVRVEVIAITIYQIKK